MPYSNCTTTESVYKEEYVISKYIYLGNPQRTGHYSESGPTAKCEIVWKSSSTFDLVSTPAISDQFIVLNEDEKVSILERSSGSLLHSFVTEGESTTALICNKTAYFGGGDMDPTVYSLNLDEGAQHWKRKLQWPAYIYGSPVVVGSLLLCAGGKTVYAFNKDTGEKAWSCRLKCNVYHTDLVVSKSSVFVVSNTRKRGEYHTKFVCISRANGELLWQEEFQLDIKLTPCYSNGKLYFVDNDSLYQFDTRNRKIKLLLSMSSDFDAKAMSYYKSNLIVADWENIYSFSTKSLEINWHIERCGLVGAVLSGDYLYAVLGNELEIINPLSGEIEHTYTMPFDEIGETGEDSSPFTLYGEHLFCSNDEGHIYCLG